MDMKSAEESKALVLRAFDTLFNKRDYAKAMEFWSENYIQHSAHIEPGRDGLFNLVRSLPDTLRYENAHVMAEGDYVMLHGRFSGHGRPRAWIAADIVRLEGGRLAEHWDVLQEEATKEESKSGLPMFGSSFPEPGCQAPSGAAPLTIEEARTIVAPLYEALNEPARKDVPALLAKATNPDYRSYSTNEEWLTRDQLAAVFKMLGLAVPDLRWTIEEIQTFGHRIVVRGKATGTPKGELWGAKPTGKSFNTMAIDIFTVKNGKLASAYHVENWVGALEQIGGKEIIRGEESISEARSISNLLNRNLQGVFGESDSARRRDVIDEIYTEDCVFYDPRKGVYRGRDEIDRMAGAIRASHPDFRYRPIAEPQVLGNGGRLQWVSGRPGEAPAYAGTDFIIARDSRIAVLYLFFDKLP